MIDLQKTTPDFSLKGEGPRAKEWSLFLFKSQNIEDFSGIMKDSNNLEMSYFKGICTADKVEFDVIPFANTYGELLSGGIPHRYNFSLHGHNIHMSEELSGTVKSHADNSFIRQCTLQKTETIFAKV